jgi:hypothetical protein
MRPRNSCCLLTVLGCDELEKAVVCVVDYVNTTQKKRNPYDNSRSFSQGLLSYSATHILLIHTAPV